MPYGQKHPLNAILTNSVGLGLNFDLSFHLDPIFCGDGGGGSLSFSVGNILKLLYHDGHIRIYTHL